MLCVLSGGQSIKEHADKVKNAKSLQYKLQSYTSHTGIYIVQTKTVYSVLLIFILIKINT